MHKERPGRSPVDVIDAPSEMDAEHSNGPDANALCKLSSSASAGPLHRDGNGESVSPPFHVGDAALLQENDAGGPAGEDSVLSVDTSQESEERQKLLRERLDLQTKILEIQRRRAELRQTSTDLARRRDDLLHRRNRAERDRLEALARYRSAAADQSAANAAFESIRKLDVTNDCFHIWHRGPFGTINGLRLGTEVPPPPSAAVSDGELAAKDGGAEGKNGTGPEAAGAAFDLSSMIWGTASLFSDQGGGGGAGDGAASGSAGVARVAAAGYDSHKVPWSEINAALGMVALLLSTLQQKPNSGIKFTTHELVPLGSFSKVGLLQPDGRPSVQYNLFYTDDSFNFFGRRNFNAALDGLFRCLKDAADSAIRIDRTVTIPHEVVISSRGEVTIGGLPIAFGADTGETWTRAMKYLLTDLKWLVAFATKNIDR